MAWWIDTFLRGAASETGASSIRKHIIGSPLGKVRLTDVTPGKIDLFLAGKEDSLSARSVNDLRGYLSRAFTLARRMEKFPRPNPVADVPKRKVVKRLPDYLRPHEVPPLFAALKPKWKPLFATALYTGIRKGELFALQKRDIDFDAGVIMVSRSHDRDIPKGGRVEAVPINAELVPYLKKAIKGSPCRRAATLLLAGIVTGSCATGGPPPVAYVLQIHEFELPSGVRVAIEQAATTACSAATTMTHSPAATATTSWTAAWDSTPSTVVRGIIRAWTTT